MKKLKGLFAIVPLMMAADWSAPVDVLHEMKPCVTYRARVEGDQIVIKASLQPGWHTFAMDNERRAAEKLAGKPSLGIDQPTQIKLSKGLEVSGGWYQSQPKDFSKPDLRWYSWGFEQEATFAAKIRRLNSGPAQIEIRGQACTETTCKNIDVSLSAPVTAGKESTDLKTLVLVR
jgi:hypothetical protein